MSVEINPAKFLCPPDPAGRNVVRNQSSHIFVSATPAGRNVGRNQFPELIRMP
jgi:hypothetical protein